MAKKSKKKDTEYMEAVTNCDQSKELVANYGQLVTVENTSEEEIDIAKLIVVSLSRIQQEIIAQLRLNPAYSRRELASIIENASLGGVISALSRLQKLGVIRRVGPDKGGHWEIVEQ